MSFVLLSDSSSLRTADEHRAFNLTPGRRLTPVGNPAQKEAPVSTPSSDAAPGN